MIRQNSVFGTTTRNAFEMVREDSMNLPGGVSVAMNIGTWYIGLVSDRTAAGPI